MDLSLRQYRRWKASRGLAFESGVVPPHCYEADWDKEKKEVGADSFGSANLGQRDGRRSFLRNCAGKKRGELR